MFGLKKEVKIFIATHKEFVEPDSNIYIPLHVGAKNKKNLGYTKDSTKDNISYKNNCFCELTGMYWIWKNVKTDIVGLVHYRRYFYKNIFKEKNSILSECDIYKILKKYDIIVAPKGYTWGTTVRDSYIKNHIEGDLVECEKILKKIYPDYGKAYDKIMNGNFYCPFNMIITRKEIFDNYCSWLFKILFELEKKIDIEDGRNNYNKRVYGFLAERLFNVWLLKNKQYKKIEKCVFNKEENMFRQKTEYFIKKVIKR